MELNAARLCVDNHTFLNFSWKCPEISKVDSTGGSEAPEKKTQGDGTSREQPDHEPDHKDSSNAQKAEEGTDVFGILPSMLWGKPSESERKIETSKHGKRHYVFVVDCSGSMGGKPIETVQETLLSFFEMIEPTDLFSLVTFDDYAKRVFYCRTQADSAEVNVAVNKISVRGSTNLCSGLVKGMNVLEKGMKALDSSHWFTNDIQNVMVLLSDGCANVGITDPSSIAAVIQADADRLEAVVYSIGIGRSYNNTLLNEITTNFAGVHYHVESSENIPYVIGNIMGDIQPVLFKDVTLTLLLPPVCVKAIQSPVHLTCQKNSSGVEIRMRSLRSRDSHNVNLRLNDAEMSNLPNPLSVQVQAKDASTGVSDVITREVNIFDVEDNNPDHDVYRSNLARLLFVEGTKGKSSEHSVEKLQELKQTLTKIPRASENATVTGILQDVNGLIDGLQNVELRGSYDYICSSAQNMHSKGRGLTCGGSSNMSSPYETSRQATSSRTMSDSVTTKRARKRLDAVTRGTQLTSVNRKRAGKRSNALLPPTESTWRKKRFTSKHLEVSRSAPPLQGHVTFEDEK